ncbi:hypothetical protein JDY09_07695 [Thermoleophilum album]|jgi:hypothetical protein|uniref:hypothetical protein n=1 Tax=Thermoleophilum album TaxID=29539 RepID=UPI00237D267C|nr:hypothetical protein [Thermoleophilum album]WDT93265.1 hypothetical protein JDY09_07695 [Thermoleophilum album]
MSVRAIGGAGSAITAAVVVPPQLGELSLSAVAAITCAVLLLFLAIGEIARRAEERATGEHDVLDPALDRQAVLERVAFVEERQR